MEKRVLSDEEKKALFKVLKLLPLIPQITSIVIKAQKDVENAEEWELDNIKAEAFDKIRDLFIEE